VFNFENNACGGNDLPCGFYVAEWSCTSEEMDFVLSGKRVHDFFHQVCRKETCEEI